MTDPPLGRVPTEAGLHADSAGSPPQRWSAGADLLPDVLTLEERYEVLYRIFEFAPDAILLVDGHGLILKANAQVERMFGYPRAELLGARVEILIPQRFIPQHVGYREGYMEAPHARPIRPAVRVARGSVWPCRFTPG